MHLERPELLQGIRLMIQGTTSSLLVFARGENGTVQWRGGMRKGPATPDSAIGAAGTARKKGPADEEKGACE